MEQRRWLMSAQPMTFAEMVAKTNGRVIPETQNYKRPWPHTWKSLSEKDDDQLHAIAGGIAKDLEQRYDNFKDGVHRPKTKDMSRLEMFDFILTNSEKLADRLPDGFGSETLAEIDSDDDLGKELIRQHTRQRATEILKERTEKLTRSGKLSIRDRLIDVTELWNRPVPEPLIVDTIDRHTVVMLSGDTGTCKTFVALDWAASYATGTSWQLREVPSSGRVLYVAGEGDRSIDRRLTAWKKYWKRDIPAGMFTIHPGGINLLDKGWINELAAIVSEEKCGYVIFDTSNRCAVGGDENSAKDMGIVVDSLYQVQESSGDGTVQLLHHTTKDGLTTRGSGALKDGVDTVYMSAGNAQQFSLTCDKRKDGPEGDRHSLRITEVAGTESCAVVRVSSADGNLSNRELILANFDTHFSTTGATRAELRDVCEIPVPSFYRSLNELVRDGALENKGTDSRPRYTRGSSE